MKKEMPNWNDLRIFLEVGRSKTLAGAARRLQVDQSTISRRIAALEAALDIAVFERDHLGFRLTPKGSDLFDCVQEMEVGALALAESLGAKEHSPAGRVRVATMEGIATLYLAGEFAHLRSRHPKLQIELVTSANLVHVNRREADLFISFFPAEGRGLQSTLLGKFGLHLYAAPAYLKARGTPQSITDLDQHDFVSYVDDLVQLNTVRWLFEAIPKPRIVFHSTSMLSQMFCAADGGGIVMLPAFARPERFGLASILREQIDVTREVWLTVHRDLQYAGRIKAASSFIVEILQRDYPAPPDLPGGG